MIALAASLLIARVAQAQAPVADPVLDRLLAEVAERNPELAQARTAVQVEVARIPQAGALADPVVSLGIQNDGFTEIAIGKMETSYFLIMATQALPFPGKRDLRTAVATVDQRRAEARVGRFALSLEAQVRRAYLDWLLTREQAGLLDELAALWTQAEATARSQYEAGAAPQSDLLRARLERVRLEQRTQASVTDVANRLAELNRLRVRPLDEPLSSAVRLETGAEPTLPTLAAAEADALARSPELQLAALGIDQAARRVELARRERLPDFSVSAGVMPRGGLTPMWQLTFGFTVPVFSARKQDKAVEENEARGIGEVQGREALRQVLALRTRQRLEVLGSLERINRRTRETILPLSEATVRSTLAQYEVGRVSFTAVLEALVSWVNDRTAYLGALADAQRVAIAQRELALEAPGYGSGSGGGSAMPQASGGPAPASAGSQGAPASAGQQNQTTGSGM